ncbi:MULTISPECIES: hypothetical protein [unclassified Sphingomonas]|jgi:uncharacterized protein YlxW (UPF0749 family)|uniref:hypothetical protein n=1 Tax=unclassified Sphingomonas TaxID=196159 RepID=UPI000E109CF7|nr:MULTISPECIES: hypothetical protein [unclassified Sphingomonas]AXJ94619.1 hypothetical protein DM480_03025 [Sphingomonas sp. FARSPH]
MRASPLALLLLLAACDRGAPAPERRDDGARRSAEAQEQKAIDGIETDVRIKALQNRVDALQAEVAEMKDGKQALDTKLLEQRLATLEQRTYAGDAPQPKPSGTPKPDPTDK